MVFRLLLQAVSLIFRHAENAVPIVTTAMGDSFSSNGSKSVSAIGLHPCSSEAEHPVLSGPVEISKFSGGTKRQSSFVPLTSQNDAKLVWLSKVHGWAHRMGLIWSLNATCGLCGSKEHASSIWGIAGVGEPGRAVNSLSLTKWVRIPHPPRPALRLR